MQDLGHGSGGSPRIDPSRIMDKNAIIVVLKPNSWVDPRQGSCHRSGELTQLTQQKLKIIKATLLWPIFFQKNGWVFDFCFISG
jgi:hypothetical protein